MQAASHLGSLRIFDESYRMKLRPFLCKACESCNRARKDSHVRSSECAGRRPIRPERHSLIFQGRRDRAVKFVDANRKRRKRKKRKTLMSFGI